ncbi:MAG TPA: metallophosphoesterase [Polyangia bacterium]|jgi:3',5'-cyclic AMP phosphodiesterase CpdA
MYRLAHVTDPHFRSFEGAHLGDFLGKRAVGALNLVVNRRRHHKMELLAALGEDLRHQPLDHVALTGDLSNVSLEAEWREALRWIGETNQAPDALTVIPGNHDAYVAEVVKSRVFETLFAPFQSSDLPALPERYPFVRFRGPLALVAINSCVATGDLGAWGEIGAAQLARLEGVLTSPALADRTRVVLLHHPPVQLKGGEDRNLKDRAAFSATLARAGAELILHGHDHRDETATLPGPDGQAIPVVGAGSASYAGSAEKRARYNIYEFEGAARRANITRVTRAHQEERDAFAEVRREPLSS